MNPRRPYPRWRPRHEEVLRWLLANPRGRQIDCAAATGYSVWQISRILNSPDFQSALDAACRQGRLEAYRNWISSA